MRKQLIPLIFVSLLACSATSTEPEMNPDFKVGEIALYMQRASMASTDFEQYKYSSDRIFHECGVLVRGRNIPAQQKLFDVAAEDRKELMELTWKILGLSQAGKALLESPGCSKDLFDPGLLVLKIKGNENALQIKTSVDATAEGTGEAGSLVNQLTRRMRALAKPGACGNRNFYGLPPLS